MTENRNLLLAIIMSGVILVGWNFFFPPPPQQAPEQVAQQQQGGTGTMIPGAPGVAGSTNMVPQVPGLSTPEAGEHTVENLLNSSERIQILSERVQGSISLRGGRIDDLVLLNYNVELNDSSQKIRLLSPYGGKESYFADWGWVGQNGGPLPGADTVWQADGKTLSPQTPVTLSWNNGQGLEFSRTLALDENFMFSITQRVRNTANQTVSLNPYGLISRWSTPETLGFFILHEGLLGVFDGTLLEVDYDDLVDDGPVKTPTTGGWLGMTDKYWLSALVPDQKAAINTRFVHQKDGGLDKYQADFMGPQISLPPGERVEFSSRFFAGAKEVKLLDAYSDNLGIQRLDLAVDFGWFYFMTKPMFYVLHWLHGVIGNYGIGILLLTVLIKLILFPLANKSYVSMAKMRKLQPQLKALQAQHKDDKQRLNKEMMELYKREKANPAAGCLPIFVQIPVFFALYKVLFISIEMRHAPFFGWVHDLSAPDPTTVFNLFGLIAWTPPDFLMIGVWPLIMGLTMWIQQKLNPQPTDPVQAKVFGLMPIAFTFILAPFPAGLVLYWAWNNTLSIIQQKVIMMRMGVD